jgi:hypothetical protein
MPARQNHRGAHPEDSRLFAPAELDKLRLSCEEASYLLGRGYAESSVVDVVGRRHQLQARQRLALQRSMCSPDQQRQRAARRVQPADVRGKRLVIDGFNLIIGLEVALSGGLLLRGSDGALRDLAGLRGSYHVVQETDAALELLAALFTEIGPSDVHFLLDAPVSNSGRLLARILEQAARFGCSTDVSLVANPDRELAGRHLVVSGDALVLDTAASWLNLLDHAVRTRLPAAWVADLALH